MKKIFFSITLLTSVFFVSAQSININPNYTICDGGSQELSVEVSGGTIPYTYLWSTGENTQSITVTPEENTIYTITVTDAANQTLSKEITVDLVTCDSVHNVIFDPRDNNTYRTVTIGNQEWMAENLKYLSGFVGTQTSLSIDSLQVDKTNLRTLYFSAFVVYKITIDIGVGNEEGQISQLNYNEFINKWQDAQDVLNDQSASQDLVDNTYNLLYEAIINMNIIPPYYYVYDYDGIDVNEAKATEYFKTYGVLYNWQAAMNACPDGWHLPTEREWTILTDYLGGEEIAGEKLKSTSGWTDEGNGTDEYGFAALPAGSRSNDGIFSGIGTLSHWWSATELENEDTKFRSMFYNDSNMVSASDNKELGYSVRCLRDIDSLTFSVSKPDAICQEQSIELTVNVESGEEPYTYEWSTGETSPVITVSPNETTTYTITVTDNVNQIKNKEVIVNVVMCDSIEDARDGNTYSTVIIDKLEWMTENLRYLPSVVGRDTGSYTEPYYYVYNYDGTNVTVAKGTENYQTYGVLYNWKAAMNACPDGWHLPSDEEWTILTDYLGGKEIAGEKLKSTSGWTNEGNGTDEYGFNALPGGYYYYGFYKSGSTGSWWNSTESTAVNAWCRLLRDSYSSVSIYNDQNKEYGYAVRCVKDKIEIIGEIPNQTIQIDAPSERFEFSDYFEYFADSPVFYEVYADNADIIEIIQNENSFGFIPLKEGVTTLYVSCWLNDEINESIQFTVTVESEESLVCNSFDITPTISHVTCNGGTNGTISVDVSGGTPPYSYRWSNTRSDNKISRVSAGYYSVLVIDSLLCTQKDTFYVQEPTEISISPSVVSPDCGASDGEIIVSTTGGKAPYTYLWNTSETSPTLSSVEAGVYTVTVTDDAGCIAQHSIELHNANAPSVIVEEVTPTACNPNDGTIQLSVNGGTAPYTFQWNDNVDSQNRTGLATGRYTVRVSDAAGCIATRTIHVPAQSIMQPEIALVTYSMMTRNNLVVWLREETDAIDFYNIYKEINGSGNFELIDIQRYDTISVYEDSRTNPLDESARYRISATDYCGNESHMSTAFAEFKTMNLVLDISEQNLNLTWDAYEGADYYRYIIYARTHSGDWIEIDTVAATTSQYATYNNSDYTAFYVAIELPEKIVPLTEYLKAESGPFSHAISNIVEIETETETEQILAESILIYPTEINNTLIVVLPNDNSSARVSITNVGGKEVFALISKEIYTEIPVNSLANGTYIITVTTETAQKSVVATKR